MKAAGPGEHLIQFLMGYSAALFIKALPNGSVVKMMMN